MGAAVSYRGDTLGAPLTKSMTHSSHQNSDATLELNKSSLKRFVAMSPCTRDDDRRCKKPTLPAGLANHGFNALNSNDARVHSETTKHAPFALLDPTDVCINELRIPCASSTALHPTSQRDNQNHLPPSQQPTRPSQSVSPRAPCQETLNALYEGAMQTKS